jgi:hypothetical protein
MKAWRCRIYALGIGLLPLAAWPAANVWDAALHRRGDLTGWLLCSVVGALGLFGVRRRIPVLRLGRASTWVAAHLALGWVALLLFFVHAEVRLPDGALEIALAGAFAIAMSSGFLGWALTRFVPKRLAAAREEVLFERIPALREEIRGEVERLVLAEATEGSGRAIADLYEKRLLPFLSGPRHVWQHWLDLEGHQLRLASEIASLERYASARERVALRGIARLIGEKHELDFHYAHQLLLRAWPLLHIPAVVALALAALVHVAAIYAIRG